jgi:hypothetical protein
LEDRLILTQPVGTRQANAPEDVKAVQAMLNRHSIETHIRLVPDGHYGPRTQRAIDQFQRAVLAMRLPDGIIPIWGPLFDRLRTPQVATHVKKKASTKKAEKVSPLAAISDEEMQAAAQSLSSPGSPCEVASIKAVAQVETKGSGFDKQGRPTILFERHLFHQDTDGKWDDTHPEISDPTSGGYNDGGTQYERLDQAEHLDSESALRSASWGAFQILGRNYKQAGFDSVQGFVKAMQTDIHAHLKAFVTFVKNDNVLLSAIQQKEWTKFALRYNGAVGKKGHKHVRDHYDTRLSEAYAAIVQGHSG